jgi:hypothetical protein
MKAKSFYLTTVMFVFLLICFNGIQAQTNQTKLNQLESAKQFLGTWQTNMGKDTVEMWEGKTYGKTLIVNVYMVIKGVKSDSYLSCFGYDDRDGKLKGYNLMTNASYGTWTGVFTTDKMFKVDGLDTFKPDVIWWKAEFEFKTPAEAIVRNFNPEGVKTGEWTFKKVK